MSRIVTGYLIRSVTAHGINNNNASNAFKEYKQDTEVSLQSINDALESQKEFYNNYASNISAVTEDSRYNTDANFRAMADSIMNMGEDGAAYMQAFVDAMEADDGSLEEMLANFGDVNSAKENFANQMAGMQYAAQTGIDDVAGVLESGSQNIAGAVDTWPSALDPSLSKLGVNVQSKGAEIPEGVAKGISGGTGSVQSAVNGLSAGTLSSLDAIASHATQKGAAISKNTASGVASGGADVDKEITKISTGTEEKLVLAENKAKIHGTATTTNYASGINSGAPAARTASENVSGKAAEAMKKYNSKSKHWGEELAQNFADGIWNKVGSVQSASNALARAASEPIHHSTPSVGPLKHDDIWGYELAENFANAMLAGKGLVSDAAFTLADAASDFTDINAGAINVSPSVLVDSKITELLSAIAKRGNEGVNVTQNIYADSTSYVDQQKQARRNFEAVAREIYA